ncbi:MAG: permease [bacterium]
MINDLLLSVWKTFQGASLYLLIGYGLATVLHIYLSPEKLACLLGKRRFGSIIKATLYGIPLPLCSCAVIPSAVALKKKGVKNGTVFAYLIATPESGLDSIAVTYGLLGWFFALFRVMAAFFIAVTTGSLIELLAADDPVMPLPDNCQPENRRNQVKRNRLPAWAAAFKDNFYDLFDETSGWLFFGLVLSGFIDYLTPAGFFQEPYFSGIYAYLLMLVIGLPMYICASASTPIAATLVYKGLSPGAALVFLIAGPATNLGSVLLLVKTFGKQAVSYYLSILSALALTAGYLIDSLASVFPPAISRIFIQPVSQNGNLWETAFAVLFILLLGYSLYRTNRS